MKFQVKFRKYLNCVEVIDLPLRYMFFLYVIIDLIVFREKYILMIEQFMFHEKIFCRIFLLDYPEKPLCTCQYYTTLLDKLKLTIQTKLPGMAGKKGLFHHDNTHVHSSAIT